MTETHGAPLSDNLVERVGSVTGPQLVLVRKPGIPAGEAWVSEDTPPTPVTFPVVSKGLCCLCSPPDGAVEWRGDAELCQWHGYTLHYNLRSLHADKEGGVVSDWRISTFLNPVVLRRSEPKMTCWRDDCWHEADSDLGLCRSCVAALRGGDA